VPSPFGAGQTVLVVEDDPAVRQVAVSTLKSLGFNVMEAASGDEAARLLKANRQVDLVFSDIRMPGKLTGIDLARLIRREMPKIRVLLTTGHVDGDETIEDIDLLYKPYRAVDLAEKIQVLMAAVQSADGEAFDVDAAASTAE
jgi:CheY-like chemotaxis protein